MNLVLAIEDRPGIAPPYAFTLTHATYVYETFIAHIVTYLCIRTAQITVHRP